MAMASYQIFPPSEHLPGQRKAVVSAAEGSWMWLGLPKPRSMESSGTGDLPLTSLTPHVLTMLAPELQPNPKPHLSGGVMGT